MKDIINTSLNLWTADSLEGVYVRKQNKCFFWETEKYTTVPKHAWALFIIEHHSLVQI